MASEITIMAVLVEDRTSVTLEGRANGRGAETQRIVSGKQRKSHFKGTHGLERKAVIGKDTECLCSAGLLILCSGAQKIFRLSWKLRKWNFS